MVECLRKISQIGGIDISGARHRVVKFDLAGQQRQVRGDSFDVAADLPALHVDQISRFAVKYAPRRGSRNPVDAGCRA